MNATSSTAEKLKAAQKATWMAGDFGMVAKYLEPGAMEIWNRLALPSGIRLLDVACVNGQLVIPAARAGIDATGIDIAPNLIEQARARAAAENLPAHFDEGDAEELPYADSSFDVVTSMNGAMFAPHPERVASELIRVCKPGGRIIMFNWTPDGFVGQMLTLLNTYMPPPLGIPSPTLWGEEVIVTERLGDRVKNLQLTRHTYPMRYPFSQPEVVEFFRIYFGPVGRAFDMLDDNGQIPLRRDLEQLWSAHNQASDDITYIESEYLEVIATRC